MKRLALILAVALAWGCETPTENVLQTEVVTDTIVQVDTLLLAPGDTLVLVDTLFVTDTVLVVDTLTVTDTVIVADTVAMDTFWLPWHIIYGTVTRPNGDPAPGIRITMTAYPMGYAHPLTATAETDANGFYKLIASWNPPVALEWCGRFINPENGWGNFRVTWREGDTGGLVYEWLGNDWNPCSQYAFREDFVAN
jgi:hypothetical protein